MKHTTFMNKTARHSQTGLQQNASAGQNAISIAPPDYRIDFVDRQSAAIQAKLKMGQPNDIYEQEADRIAEQVMRMSEPPLQRQAEVEEEEKLMRAKPADGPTRWLATDMEAKIQSLEDGGQPLAQAERNFMESRLAYDFSGVRVHTDTKAAEVARALNARAFTVGRSVAFAPGQYTPGTSTGKRLLAHELTHVVQQSGAEVRRIQCQEEPEEEPKTTETAEPIPAEATTSCALTTFVSDRFINKTPVIDVEFKDSMETIERYAKDRDVKVYVTDHFREADTSPSGAIVPPATKSNHKAGHAIDMNVKYGADLYNSTKLKKSNLNAQPAAVKGFIQDIRDDSDLRWGGDFSTEDPVHIDDHLNASNDAWQKRFDATQEARKKGCG